MASKFTPLIGLAVVVALALAAVFGAMSLTNPAFAAIGQPADAELTEREFSPQSTDRMVNLVAEAPATWLRIDGYVPSDQEITGTGHSGNSDATDVIDDLVAADFAAGTGSSEGELEVRLDGLIEGRALLTITVVTDDQDNHMVVLDIRVSKAAAESDATFDEIPDLEVGRAVAAAPDAMPPVIAAAGEASAVLDVSEYLTVGSTPVEDYMATVTGTDVEVAAEPEDADEKADFANPTTATSAMGKFRFRAADGQLTNVSARVTVVAQDDELTPTVLATQVFYVKVVAVVEEEDDEAIDPMFMADSTTGGSVARYQFDFTIPDETNTLIHDLVIELEDFGVPSSISTSSVTIESGIYTFTPEDVSTDGEEIFISIGDVTEDVGTGGTRDTESGGVYIVGGNNAQMTVVFRKSAGISNPTEAGTFPAKITFDELELETAEIPVLRKISTDEEDGGLGTVVTATGKGYKNGTSLTVFVDRLIPVMWNVPDDGEGMIPLPYDMVSAYDSLVEEEPDRGNIPMGNIPADDGEAMHTYVDDGEKFAEAPNRRLDLGEDQLCVVDKIGGNDVGKCEFTVSHPTFGGGLNYINAVDGRNGYAPSPDTFELTASIQASPDGGSPGEIILVQVVDFTRNAEIDKVQIGRQNYCGDDANPVGETNACRGSVDSTGSGNFKITIPNWARAGVQELKVWDTSDESASTNVTLSGPQIQVTPQTVLSNQRVSLVGVGFSSGAMIGDEDGSEQISEISIGGEVIPWKRVSGGADVDVDSGGNWSASVDLPFSEATTAEGERIIRITDSGGRSGDVVVDVPAREVTITPASGRVGTIAVVRGNGFPSKNDEGSSFNIEIVYDAGNDKEITVSAVPDASGRFEVQLRIPTTASIPSNNTVKVSFEDDDDVVVVTTVAHEVPEGVINLSTTSGGPGSAVTINGEGFKAFVPISSVMIGSLDITPAPKPSTDGNGMMSFTVTIPGLDVGIQTIEVDVGQTTSSTGFTVTESGVNPGDIKEVAAGLEPLGDNFVSVWHFNNDTKMWSFYTPALEEGNSLSHLITGETYLIRIKSTVEVILNNDTRNLTCVGDNCWNQIVW